MLPVKKYSIFRYAAEDFVSRRIPFTIPGNQTVANQSVEIVVVDDDMLEPQYEGFRLLLIVDESRTPLSQVTFSEGRQLALFRIDDQMGSELYLTDMYITTASHFLYYFSKISFQPLHTDLWRMRST